MMTVWCMVPDIWSATDRTFCHFRLLFVLLPSPLPLTTQKIKILKKCKKQHLEISSFYTSVPQIIIICYTSPEIWRMADGIMFHFGPFLPFYPSNSPQNQNLKKWKKKPGDTIISQVYQKSWSYAILFLAYGT